MKAFIFIIFVTLLLVSCSSENAKKTVENEPQDADGLSAMEGIDDVESDLSSDELSGFEDGFSEIENI